MRLGFLCVSLLTLVAMASAVDYCTAKCFKGTHTMCKFKEDKPAAACQGFKDIELKEADKKVLLDLHNEYRNKVALGKETRGSPGPQPAAANMRALKWDKELATIARRWALQCVKGHDDCRNLAKGDEPAGQNAAWSTSSNLQQMVAGWYDEVEDVNTDVALVNFNSPKTIGDYTQLVWAETDRVGCSRIETLTPESRFTLFCNYAVTVNAWRKALYEAGKPCSKCPDGLKCNAKYPGLCGEDGWDMSDTVGDKDKPGKKVETGKEEIFTSGGEGQGKSGSTYNNSHGGLAIWIALLNLFVKTFGIL